MNTWFDVIAYVFEWATKTYYVPITILDTEITFTIMGLLLIPFYAFLGVKIMRHLIELSNE